MTTLFLHIEYLLHLHDCVIVPTLGAFIINRRPARFDAEAGVIIPPSSALTFNHSVSNNDGLLASSIARRMGTGYDEAVEILDETVAVMRAQLSTERRLKIGTLGVLALGPENNIMFTPAVNESDRYGLHSVLLPKLAPKVEESSATEEAVASNALNVVSPREPGKEPERKFRPDKYYYIPVHKLFAKMSAVMMVMAVAVWVMLAYSPEVSDAPRRDRASVIPVVVESHAVMNADTPAVKSAVDPDTVGKYHIVVGTFTDIEKARHYMTQHSADGFDLQLVPGKRYHRVTAARSIDRDEMVATLRSGSLDSCFHHSWIWEN